MFISQITYKMIRFEIWCNKVCFVISRVSQKGGKIFLFLSSLRPLCLLYADYRIVELSRFASKSQRQWWLDSRRILSVSLGAYMHKKSNMYLKHKFALYIGFNWVFATNVTRPATSIMFMFSQSDIK